MNTSEELVFRAQEWLKKINTINHTDIIEISTTLLEELQEAIQAEDAPKKIIGRLISQIRNIQKQLQSLELMQWMKVGNGYLAIGHRPSNKLIDDLKWQNTSHILTLLSISEGSDKIKQMVLSAQLEWLWFPMASAQPPADDQLESLAHLFIKMESILKTEGKIYIHCSAGIHRTGMITYSFLRFIGYDQQEALLQLNAMRPTTKNGVGEERLSWGDSTNEALQALRK